MIDPWSAASAVLRWVPPAPPQRFGLRQALACGVTGSAEWMDRHVRILARLEVLRRAHGLPRLRVLDFGGAAGALAKVAALHALIGRYRIVLADVDGGALRMAPRARPVVGVLQLPVTGGLPLLDRAVDVVVSSDVFEHIPAPHRPEWASELARVARLGQIHTVPCQSEDGEFAGAATDDRLQAWHVATFGRADAFTAEHQARGLPSPEELRALFPGARLEGFANAGEWLEVMQEQLKRPSRLGRLAGGVRFLRRRRALARAPFKNCLVDALASADPR